MSVENRKLLTDALRSGKYKQGRISLRRGDEHCCLGVACEIYQQHVGDLEIIVSPDGLHQYDGCNAYLPPKVQAFFGLTFEGKFETPVPCRDIPGEKPPQWAENDEVRTLTMCNDSLRLSFEEIADLIDTRRMQTTSDEECDVNKGKLEEKFL